MAAAAQAFNAFTRFFYALDDDDLVSTIDTAATATDKWDAIETYVGTAKELKGVIEEVPPVRGEPNALSAFFYGSGGQAVSYPGLKQAREFTFNIRRFDRSNVDHAALEDADGIAGKKISIALITITDGQAKTVANTAAATARCADCNLISAHVTNGPGEEEQMLAVTLGVEEVADPVDQTD